MTRWAITSGGTMGNIVSILTHTRPGDSVIVEERSHIYNNEGEVDVLHSQGLKANFAKARESGDTVRFIVAREIFKHLEKISDAFEDVANQIDGLAVDHA